MILVVAGITQCLVDRRPPLYTSRTSDAIGAEPYPGGKTRTRRTGLAERN